MKTFYVIALALIVTSLGCSHRGLQLRDSIRPATVENPAKLTAAVEAFYGAGTVAAASAAVQEANRLAPGSGAAREIAATLALMKGDSQAGLTHLMVGLRDGAATNAHFLLERLGTIYWSLDDRRRLLALWAGLIAEHPDPTVRASAAWKAMGTLKQLGEVDSMKTAKKQLGFVPDFALLGPFENDQGKGADTVYAPEKEVDLTKTYKGRLGLRTWRQDYPRRLSGLINFSDFYYPAKWQIVYGVAGVRVAEAGTYEIRIASADGVKVWLNGAQLFQNRKMSKFQFDGLVLPVQFRKGVNRLLIKSIQGTGPWKLAVRVTGQQGTLVRDGILSNVAGDTPISADETKVVKQSLADSVGVHIRGIEGRLRRAAHTLTLYRGLGLAAETVKMAEKLAVAYPESIVFKGALIKALWDNGERGRTADLLNKMSRSVGDDLLTVRLSQARFWQQQKMYEKARKLLLSISKVAPNAFGPKLMLARAYRRQRWHAERCEVLKDLNHRWPGRPIVLDARADCLEDMSFYSEAKSYYQQILDVLPNNSRALKNMHWIALGNDRFSEALGYAERLLATYPYTPRNYTRLAETLRRMGRFSRAKETLNQATKLTPSHPGPHRELGEIAIQQGNRQEAVRAWSEALSRKPADRSLMARVDWLAPKVSGPWLADVPSDEDIEAAIQIRNDVKPVEGSNVIYLLDDEVTRLNADGSQLNMVTTVAHAVNQTGRDKLTKLRLRAGRHKVLKAYAVGPTGRRQEASSIRSNTVRFRQLSVGSTVILQYRVDERADGYLAGHISRRWWFQGGNAQARVSRWVLWMPSQTTLHEAIQGPGIARSEKKVGELTRLAWTAKDQVPVIAEPRMPGFQDVANHLVLSTVPSWEMFFKWEEALLVDAFRESPEVVALAKELAGENTSPSEKIHRIHVYLMNKIRYQQDYERSIAGVKPHAAPVVLARQYGDCKDKAVLFITLARLMGLKVHFALVRTRDAGAVARGVPMQQFNHAIVYVPKQPGIVAGRFYDPTVDALDVEVLRHDDQGTWSAVYDPDTHEHTWRQIPFQKADLDFEETVLRGALSASGDVTGEYDITVRGRGGQALRKAARNPELFRRVMSQLVAQRAMPGAELRSHDPLQLTNVVEPARLKMGFSAKSVARREGKSLRLPVPIDWTPSAGFVLKSRKYPLLLGVPRTMKWRVELAIPKGAKASQLPDSVRLQARCMQFERTVSTQPNMVSIAQSVTIRCERIPALEYTAHRVVANQISAVLNQDLSITTKGTALAHRR